MASLQYACLLDHSEAENEDSWSEESAGNKVTLSREEAKQRLEEFIHCASSIQEAGIPLNERAGKELEKCYSAFNMVDNTVLFPLLVERSVVPLVLELLSLQNMTINMIVLDFVLNIFEEAEAIELKLNILHTETEQSFTQTVFALVQTLRERQLCGLLIPCFVNDDMVPKAMSLLEFVLAVCPDVIAEVLEQGLLHWILNYLGSQVSTKLMLASCSGMLSRLLDASDDARITLGNSNGIELLLQLLESYKRTQDANKYEDNKSTALTQLYVKNLLGCLGSAVIPLRNRQTFQSNDGLSRICAIIQQHDFSYELAVRVLAKALDGPDGKSMCETFVDFFQPQTIIPGGICGKHSVYIFASILQNCDGDRMRRVLRLFEENGNTMVRRIMILYYRQLQEVEIMYPQLTLESRTMYLHTTSNLFSSTECIIRYISQHESMKQLVLQIMMDYEACGMYRPSLFK